MAYLLVFPIHITGILELNALHELGKGRFLFHQQKKMKVIRHQGISKETKIKLLLCLSTIFQKHQSIYLVEENRLFIISSSKHMVWNIRNVNTQFRHLVTSNT